MDKDDDDRDDGDAGMSITRYQIMPSLISLLTMRNRLHLAFLGKKLMKWTALATGKELRRIAMEIGGVILKYEMLIKDAFIMLAQCRFHLPGVNTIILETAPKNAMITFASSGRSIAGVKVVNFEVRESGQDGYAFLGMGKGGEVIRETKERWRKLVKTLIVMCQFRENFILTDAANKAATKKQNVLKRLIVPKITMTITYILSELDEQEREESFRLKRFKQLKYKNPKEESKTLEEEPESIEEKPKPIEEKPEPIIEIPEPIEVKPEPIIEKPEPIVEKPEPIVEKPETIKEIPAVTVAPAIIPESPQVEQPMAETPEVDLIMSHINEVVKLADLLRSSAMLPKHFGLTKCDLGRLKSQLDETIKLSKTAKEDRECVKCEGLERTGSPCTCPASVDAPIKAPATQISKEPPYFEAAPEYQAATKTPTLIPEYILKPRVIPDIKILEDKVKAEEDVKPEGKMNLDELEKHIDQVLCMTYCYKKEKLLSVSAEDFLKCCHSVKNKLQEIKIQREVKAKIGLLKDKVEHLEKVTNIVERELSTTSISSFMSCCQEFKDKLERRQSCRGAPSVASIENLVKRIDLSIVLGKEAIKEGLVSESVEEFVSTCTEIKEKIDPQAKPKPKVIKDLLLNVTDIIKQISKYKDDGELSKSIEKLFTTCETTKAKLDCYKPPQVTCPNKVAKQASQQSCKPNISGTCIICDEAAKKQSQQSRGPKSSISCQKCDAAAKKALQQSLKAKPCENCLICDEAAKKASQQSLKPKPSSTCPKCDQAAKKQSQQSRGPKSSASCQKCDAVAKKASQQSLEAKSCENCLICDKAAKKASQQSLKPKPSSTCPKCDEAAKKQSQQSRGPKSSASCQKCDAVAKKASQQSLEAKSCENCPICDKAAKKASQQSLKPKPSSTCPKCDEAAKKQSQQSRSPKSSTSCQKCDADAKKASHQSLKAKSCENCLICDELAKQQSQKQSYGPESFTTCLECHKGAKQQSQTSCKSTPKQITVPVKKRSCVCSKKTRSRSDSTYSKVDESRGKSKSRECCSFQDILPTFVQISVNQQSKRPCTIIPFQDLESDCIKSVKHRHSESNICRSACYNKDQKVGLKRNAMSMVILKTFKNVNSSDKQTVTEFPLPYKLERTPSQTSSHPTGFCESVESTNSVSLCNKPRTKGFIQIVKNVKSEKLISCQDLSKSHLPFLWPHSSVDTLVSQDRNNESIQENPFF